MRPCILVCSSDASYYLLISYILEIEGFACTIGLRHKMAGLELGPRSIGREAGAETLILKASTGRGRGKLLLDYVDTPDTIAMRADMEAINGFLNEADLKLDGKPLPQEHGAPVRVVIPEMYGYKNVKWVERIELVAKPGTGYWENLGYDRNAWIGHSNGYG